MLYGTNDFPSQAPKTVGKNTVGQVTSHILSKDRKISKDCNACNPKIKDTLLVEACTCDRHNTVGALAMDLLSKGDQNQSVIDTSREMTKGYIQELVKCALEGAKLYDKPFYVCVQTRRERLLVNVIRNQFYHRQTRPRPIFDLALYHYDPKDENLNFVWCIPDKQTVSRLIEPTFIPEASDKQLWQFCMAFVAGTLI